jgi:hypothetical protein
MVPGIFHYTYLGPTFGVVQNVVETRRRATATAVLFFFLNFIALGGGPFFTGWIIDAFAQFHFSHPGQHSIFPFGLSSRAVAHAPRFSTLCPGGVAPAGAGATASLRCKSALVAATREGIIVTVCFYAWAAFHYLLGSFGLAERLAKVASERRAREFAGALA